tara:strand:- start:881 stop:1624 length:744 start_codon:yes stop_codon:yes gene_type:complete
MSAEQELQEKKLEWKPGRGATMLFGALILILLGLSAWQISRSHEKARLSQLKLERKDMMPIDLLPAEKSWEFLRVKISGAFEPNRVFLVAATLSDHSQAYTVLQSFLDFEGRRWLVNRGLVEAPVEPEVLDVLGGYPEATTLIGTLWPDHAAFFPPMSKIPVGWPKHVDRINWKGLSAAGLSNYVEMEFRLDMVNQAAFLPPPRDLRPLVRQHRAYAIQWFGLSIILTAAYALHGLSRRGHSSRKTR